MCIRDRAKTWPDITRPEVYAAAEAAYAEYESHMEQVRTKATEIIAKARSEGRQIIVLAGRPYHVDPEINHGIDKLICSHGAAVITEDSISHLVEKFPTSILNQWTYHSRLYAAAKYIADQPDMNLVQLVSFGCGVDEMCIRDSTDAGTLTSATLVALSGIFTALGWYQKLAARAGAGTLVPITGFANAVVSPAIEFRSEGLVTGVGAKMFVIAGPVIVYGMLASVGWGILYHFLRPWIGG